MSSPKKKMKRDETAEETDLSTQSAPNTVRVTHADVQMDVNFDTTTIQSKLEGGGVRCGAGG